MEMMSMPLAAAPPFSSSSILSPLSISKKCTTRLKLITTTIPFCQHQPTYGLSMKLGFHSFQPMKLGFHCFQPTMKLGFHSFQPTMKLGFHSFQPMKLGFHSFQPTMKLGFHSFQPMKLGFHSSICKAQSDDLQPPPPQQSVVYEGVYGPWTIEPHDIREVFVYRSGLVTTVASFLVPASTAFLPQDSSLSHFLLPNLDFFFFTGATGLGISLYFIHIYVSQIKFALQSVWALGLFGSLLTYAALARPTGLGLVQYVVVNPWALWFVGPLFAALTGLVFKEGLCYAKLEAALLTFLIPTLLLGHLSGLMDDGVKLSLLAVWMSLFVVFAARKFTQPVKDDIGDKSVFMFNSLAEEEKAALCEKLQQ